MKDPLMSTPTNMTRRPASGACALGPPAHEGASRAVARIATQRARTSGRLPLARCAQLLDQLPRVLEVPHTLERQIEQVPARREHGGEVERRRDQLHRWHQERVEEPLPFLADPVELLLELADEAVGEQAEVLARAAGGAPGAAAAALDDPQDRGRARGGEQEPRQAADAEPGEARDRQRAEDPEVEVL